ncbi:MULTISPECIES: transglycosylase SLT domain-containing protein [unclassified Pseudodesulfovibrio]|uniref:transglycosylase SLT domain-containing protein n=1 Tax=unclassified Pseudodesulfovibrio TaxID=2661612 RepID=UPI000FEB7A0C|nr:MULTISPECIES: transglycosylase SLT domain-containing protein [unclassified Pseudodesulfovibrio]MCJ2164656.1 transglycosylase SLT domain-containing protein [Pseudodesulfovibrio sp. S3-i]RWU04152.1 lytic transglycosylase domain-containing protein [Pseudodesulfovibrio sp. S3]
MPEVAGLSFLIDLVYTLTSALLLFYGLRFLDKRSGRPWKGTMATIRQDPLASALYHGLRILALCLFAGLLMGCAPAHAGGIPDRYDSDIQEAVHRWWPRGEESRWEWWKAQLYQESQLNPEAVSPVGARGLAQFMPGTWDDVCRQLGYGRVSPHLVKQAVNAGAYYMVRLRNAWTSPRPEIDRWDLARASYNAGFGNILKAQGLAGGASRYADIIAALPSVTGRHAQETIIYNQRIHRWYGEITCSR